jgi:hypothetical protein
MLRDPATLYSDDSFTVWHPGVVLSPVGRVVFGLEIDSARARAFHADPAWELGGTPPVEAYLQLVDDITPNMGDMWSTRGKRTFAFREWFQFVQPERLPGVQIHLKVHPLGLDRVIDIPATPR